MSSRPRYAHRDLDAPGASGDAPQPARRGPLSRHAAWLVPLAIALASIVCYANTLGAGFTWDDEWLVLTNRRLTDPALRADYVEYMLFERTLWRPFKRISLMADYALWMDDRGTEAHWTNGVPVVGGLLGKLQGAAGFHMTNLLFHTLVCLAAYALVRRLGAGLRVAALTGLLFAVHPVHVEGVANISHRKEPMSLLFYLLGFIAYLVARRGDPPRVSLSGAARRIGLLRGDGLALATRIEFLCYTLVCYLSGMLSKEVGAVMLPATVLVYELVVAPGTRREKLRRFAMLLAPFAAVLVLFVAKGYLGSLPRRFSAEQIDWITGGQTESYFSVILITLKAFWQYVAMLVWPHPLYLDRAFAIPSSLANGEVLAGLLLVIGYFAALAWSVRRAPFACFALAWYGLNLFPVLNVVPLTHWLIAERFLYVPSLGFAMLVALGLDALASGRLRALPAPSGRAAAAVVAGVLVIVHGWLTIRQNRVWHDSKALWAHTLKYNDRSYRGLYGYGLELDHEGKAEEAIGYYERSIDVYPSYPEPYYATALLKLNQREFDEAIELATEHAGLARKDPEPYMVIGNAWFGKRDYMAAAEAYLQAVERDPDHADALFNLANALYGAGQYPDAIQYAERAAALRPSVSFVVLLGNIQELAGMPDDAIATFRRAADLAPGDVEPLNALAMLLVRQRRYAEAAAEIERSLAVRPDQPRMQSLLARLPR